MNLGMRRDRSALNEDFKLESTLPAQCLIKSNQDSTTYLTIPMILVRFSTDP